MTHLTALVDDLLLLARSDSGAVPLERLPLDLGDVAFEAASALGRTAEAGGVHVAVDPEPAMVVGDPARLRQLVMILVDNAIRHSPRGRRRDRDRAVGDRARASIEVADEGPGLRAEDMPHVFDRFWRAPGCPVGRDRARACDRALDHRAARRPDRRGEPGRRRRRVPGRAAGRIRSHSARPRRLRAESAGWYPHAILRAGPVRPAYRSREAG